MGASDVIAALALIWAIWQTRVTSNLQHQVYQLNLDLDQTIQRLYRARDLVNEITKTRVLVLFKFEAKKENRSSEDYLSVAEFSMYSAELEGLVCAIDDSKLKEALHQHFAEISPTLDSTGCDLLTQEAHIRGCTQQLHIRIYELLEEATRQRRQVTFSSRIGSAISGFRNKAS